MRSEITISYSWEPVELKAIPERHKEALQEDAYSRIFQMIKDGYTSGELFTSVRYGQEFVPEEHEEDGIEYKGWWSMTYKMEP